MAWSLPGFALASVSRLRSLLAGCGYHRTEEESYVAEMGEVELRAPPLLPPHLRIQV
jgi:hypothetical protein